MTYNLTGIVENGTSLVTLTQGVNNQLMFGWLGTILLIALAVVFYTSYMFVLGQNGALKGLAATMFMTTIFGLLLRAMNLIGDLTLFIVVVIAALTIAVTTIKD